MKENTFEIGVMYWENPKHSLEEIEKDMAHIKENNFTIIRIFIWWENVEASEGQFDFKHHDLLYKAAEKYNIKIMETFGFYLPIWLQKKLATMGIEDKGRYACLDRPEVMEYLGKYLKKVVKRYKDSPALAIWNLWNEPCKTPCECEHTFTKFAGWLKERYSNIENLKNAWLGEFQVFSTVCPNSFDNLNVTWLQDMFRYAKRGRNSPMEYDWLEFSTYNLDDNMRWLRDLVKNIDKKHETHANPDSPVFNSFNKGLDEWKLAKTLDSLSVSIHPSHYFFQVEEVENFPGVYSYCLDQAKSWAVDKDAWVGELQAGTTFYHSNKYTASSSDVSHYLWQAVGRGMKGVLFWIWQSWRSSMMEVSEFSLRRCYDGAPTERSEAAAAMGKVIKKYKTDFAQVERSAGKVAIMMSKNTKIFKSMQQINKPWAKGDINNDHNFAAYGCYKALNRANISIDFITEAQIEESILSNYDVLFMPHVEIMSATVASKLKYFVSNGGWLWADGRCAFLDEHVYLQDMIPGHGLNELFGCQEADFVSIRDNDRMITTQGNTIQSYRQMQYLEPTTGNAIANYHDRIAAVRNSYGKGIAELNGSYVTRGIQINPDPDTMDYIANFAFEAGVKPKVKISPSLGFEVCLLSSQDVEIIIVSNTSNTELEAEILAPQVYSEVICPQDKEILTKWDESSIQRHFEIFETAVFICKIKKYIA